MSGGIGRGSKEPSEQLTAEEQAELAAAMTAMRADPEFKTRLQQAQAALCAGFLPWLEKAFPERWDPNGWKCENNDQLCADIEYVSGYSFELLCADRQSSYAAQKQAFDAFAQENFSRPEQLAGCSEGKICFHGSSRESVQAIHEGGFDSSLWKEGAYGNGGYVSPFLSVALAYSELDDDVVRHKSPAGLLWAAYGRAHLGDPVDIPVGTRGQTDFGVREDGTRHMTLTNPARTYFCVRDPRQFLATGFFAFKIRFDQRPSDFALRNMIYHPKVWLQMTQCIPGLVEYKKNLLKEANMDREDRQNRRQELKRLAELQEGDEGGSAARRTRGA